MKQGANRKIAFNHQKIAYCLRVSPRARHLRITIKPGGEMTVTKPRSISEMDVEKFLLSKADWITRNIKLSLARKPSLISRFGKREFKKFKSAARSLVIEKIRHFNSHYRFCIGSVAIRNQKSRWGSCSRARNLNFNFRVAFLPDPFVDYIVVHELCHLGELNHSKKFWNLVGQTVPNYKVTRRQLKKLY